MPKTQFIQNGMVANQKDVVMPSRRKFLGFAGAATGLIVIGSSCNKNDMPTNPTGNQDYDLGSGDIGILNYAYALEQLEAAFYTKVIDSQYSGIGADAASITDIRDHEIAHREFFKSALGAKAIGILEFDFSSIDFGSRDSVLGTAKAFEDLGVTAYNGAGRLIVSADYLVLAGKIVSVEARHAAYIRELISPGSFADNTALDSNGLDGARKPADVLAIASTYIKTKITASNLPTY